jgi:hypothetical protein
VTGPAAADASTMSAECALAQRPDYQGLHDDCRRTVNVPLPHHPGIVLVPRCTCGCHRYNR